MKKALLILCGFAMTGAAHAQTPVNRSMAIVQKATATWCGPCGQWGWTLQEDITADNMSAATPNGFVFACYGSNTSNYYNKVADTLTSWGQSWPNWAVNNVNRTAFSLTGGIYTTTTRTDIKKAVDSFAAIAPTASTGFRYTISGNTLTFNTVTKFWKAATGAYALAVYIIEDSVYGIQNGQTGSVYHHSVLRGRISGATYGDQIATGTTAVNSSFTRNYTYSIDPTWNKAHLKFVTVLWKLNGATWQVENANSLKSAATAVGNIEAVDQLIVYPNPATSRLQLSGALNTASGVRLSLTNAVGQTVYQKDVAHNGGQLMEDIDLSGLSNGVYLLTLGGAGVQSARKVVVAR